MTDSPTERLVPAERRTPTEPSTRTGRFTLIWADGLFFYASSTPGTIGGHRLGRIYGQLNCRAAARALARGDYARHRVFFFADEETARAAGYRPCAVCLRDRYRAWSGRSEDRGSSSENRGSSGGERGAGGEGTSGGERTPRGERGPESEGLPGAKQGQRAKGSPGRSRGRERRTPGEKEGQGVRERQGMRERHGVKEPRGEGTTG